MRGLGSAFDEALELSDLWAAADWYASRDGRPGSAAYYSAWWRFRKKIRTTEDLRRLNAAIEASARQRERDS
ncbi:MAG TPA: hypothetical protein VMB27_25040 [Solirubrobacteraceae bacterium]|nr:hypothetical protein [Solirubrobacteraceae bacterium]